MKNIAEKLTYAQTLRENKEVHYNCCQSVLCAWAGEMGLSQEQAFALGQNLGAGMRVGSMCGAVNGALIALGAMGYGEKESRALLQKFQEKNEQLHCVPLLKMRKERGIPKKEGCDMLVADAIRLMGEVISR